MICLIADHSLSCLFPKETNSPDGRRESEILVAFSEMENRMNLKRTAAAGMVMAAAMICSLQLTGITAMAATGTAAFSANIRSAADPNSTAIGSVEAGTTMDLGESKTGTDGNTWYAVTTSSGSTGYIRGDLLNVEGGDAAADSAADTTDVESTGAAEGEASAEGTDTASAGVAKAQGDGYAVAMQQTSATINGDCNIRSGAGTSYNKVGTLASGTALVVIGQAADDAGQMWYQFYTTGTEQQMTGFVMQDYITLGDVIQTDTATDSGDGSQAADSSQPTDYQAVYTADENGTDTWYLYNNVEGTREKIADIDIAIEQAQQAQASAKKSLSTFKTAVIILGVIVALLLVAVTVLILKLREAMTEGGEVDMMRDRERERRRNRHADDISDLEFDSATGTSRSERMRQAAYPSGMGTGRSAAAHVAAANGRPGAARGAAGRNAVRANGAGGAAADREAAGYRAGAGAAAGRTAVSRSAATRPASRNTAAPTGADRTPAAGRPASRNAAAPTGADRENAAYRNAAAGNAGTVRSAARPGAGRSAAPAGREGAVRRTAAPAGRAGSYSQQQSRPVRNNTAGSNSYGFDDEDDLDFDFLDLDDHGKR